GLVSGPGGTGPGRMARSEAASLDRAVRDRARQPAGSAGLVSCRDGRCGSGAAPGYRPGVVLVANGHMAEGRQWLAQSRSHASEVSLSVRAEAFTKEGWLAFNQFDHPLAASLAVEGLGLAREAGDTARMAD